MAVSVIDIRDAKSLRMILWKKRLCEVERGRRKRERFGGNEKSE